MRLNSRNKRTSQRCSGNAIQSEKTEKLETKRQMSVHSDMIVYTWKTPENQLQKLLETIVSVAGYKINVHI